MFEFLHLMSGTTFFGIMIATFYYIARSLRQDDQTLINYSLKASYFGDGIIFFIVLIQLITATHLVSAGHFTLAIPWIFIAYHAFGTIVLLWIGIFLIKLLYLSKTDISPITLRVFYSLNVMMILLFIIIIHDAVTQSTWFDFLFRK